MMAQAAAIRDATDPDEVLFVVDAMIGQDAVATAQAFLDGVGYDGVVLTKLDGDARGGAALSIVELTGRPIMFASSGEKLPTTEGRAISRPRTIERSPSASTTTPARMGSQIRTETRCRPCIATARG